MSLTREATNEICDYIKEQSANLFSQKFRECRFITSLQIQLKSDKFETKFLVISKFRVFILLGKCVGHLKIEKCFNILALRQLHINSLNIVWEDRGRFVSCYIKMNTEKEAIDLACEFLSTLKHYFPDIRKSLANFLHISPTSLLSLFSMLPSSTPDLPCNNFRRSYVTYCDYIDQSYREDVVWEIEHVYFIHDIHKLRLDDFNQLQIKDQVAIIGSIQFSSYFNEIFVDSFKLSTEHIDVILTVVRRSHSLQCLNLINCGLPKDFAMQLSTALQHNLKLPLKTLNLSNNYIDDKKGILQLATTLSRLHTLRSIILNDCGLSEKSIHNLAIGLYNGFTVDGSSTNEKFELKSLSLSKNSIKDDANELINFISLCNTLRLLDLSHTGFVIDKLWPALKLGGLQLKELRLSNCQVGKKSKENLQATVKELFSSMINLNELDLSGTIIGPELLQSILLGLSNNNRICNITLNLDGALDNRLCALVIEQNIINCPIETLCLRDNVFEHEATKILPIFSKIRQLKTLDLGGTNFYGLRNNKKANNTLSKVLTDIGDLISNPASSLENLILSDCRLGCACLSVVLDSLSAATKLVFLDISNNEIGNVGARLLSKALQLNNSLKKINFDRNQIGLEGFQEIAHGLKLNNSIISIIYPINDFATIPDRLKLQTIMNEIEKYLDRNKKYVNLSKYCCQSTLQSLISNCDKYNINDSDENKIIFHNLIKCIVDVSNFSTLNNSIKTMLNQILKNIENFSTENSKLFVQKFCNLLKSKNIEICDELNSKKFDESNIEEQILNNELCSTIENYLTRVAWKAVYNQSDHLLSSQNALKIRGELSNCNIDNSIHAAISERFNGNRMIRRPNSVFHESLIASLISGEQSMNSSSNNEESIFSNDILTPLIHLVKNRPKPPRQLKNKSNLMSNQTCENQVVDGSLDYVNDSKLIELNGTDKNNDEVLQNKSAESIQELQTSPFNNGNYSSTPPPLIPRRVKINNVPPKLPPKPINDL